MLHKQLLVNVVSSSSCLLLHSNYVFSGNLSFKIFLKIISVEMMKLRLRAQDRSTQECPSLGTVQARGRRLWQLSECWRGSTSPSPSPHCRSSA